MQLANGRARDVSARGGAVAEDSGWNTYGGGENKQQQKEPNMDALDVSYVERKKNPKGRGGRV